MRKLLDHMTDLNNFTAKIARLMEMRKAKTSSAEKSIPKTSLDDNNTEATRSDRRTF